MSKIDEEYKYEQKKINHVFHYTSDFRDLQKIIRNGFAPSYCREKIGNYNYLTPMVSFCNIPIAEVDKYMRYGKNGIGMSLNWAIKNALTPVTYIHENSPYHSVLKSIDFIRSKFSFGDKKEMTLNEFIEDDNLIEKAVNNGEMNIIALNTLRYLKNWKTDYKGDDVITYQEREWRYIPLSEKIKPIITESEPEFESYSNKKIKPKPHFVEYPLKTESIDDIRYIVVTTELQRTKIIGTLKHVFSNDITTDAIVSGRLSILTASQIRNDF